MDNIGVALTVLVTGFVVVFAVLIMLIFVIKLYSTIVYKAQKASEKKKEEKLKEAQTEQKAEQSQKPVSANTVQEVQQGIPPQVVAAISAAVYTMYGEKNCKIKSIKKLPQARPAWSMAGIMDNTHPFGG